VSLGGPVTETLFALGAGDRVVAVDVSSVYPTPATKLPQVGYYRALSAEGILALNPDLVLGGEDAGPPPALAQLRGAKVPVVLVNSDHTVEGARKKILVIAAVLEKPEEGRRLVAALNKDLDAVQSKVARVKNKPHVLFIYARGQGALSVSGRNTAADAMITMAGGVNAITGYEGYKPLTPEALAAAAPEVILVTTRGLESIGGKTGLADQPGVGLTPAGKKGRIIALDDELLLGFGPRLGQGVLTLHRMLHPDANKDPTQ
jgi:iron complex transport system substrate-binding protein